MCGQIIPLASETQLKAPFFPDPPLFQRITSLSHPLFRALSLIAVGLSSLQAPTALPHAITPSLSLIPTTALFTLFGSQLAFATPTPTPTSFSPFPNITDFRINTYTNGTQSRPSATGLSDGGFVVTWTGEGQGDMYGIFGRRYFANGTTFGPEFRANTYTNGTQVAFSVTGLSGGGFVVTWYGAGQGDTVGIFGQRYTANGMAFGGEFRANTYTANDQRFPSATDLSDGGFVVTWTGEGQGDTYGIFGQRYHANGTAFGCEFRVNTYTANNQWYPSATDLLDGGFVVTWWGAGQGDTFGTFAQRYTANGMAFGPEFRANTYTANFQRYPSATSLPDGGFVVTWYGEGQGDISGIFGQRYTANGTAFGLEFRVNTYTANSQYYPSATSLPDGGFVVTWFGAGQGDTSGIFGQRYHANGTALGLEFRANTYTVNSQRDPSATGLPDGGFVVTWRSEEQPGSGIYDIFGKRYDRIGVPIPWEQPGSTFTAPPPSSALSSPFPTPSLPPSPSPTQQLSVGSSATFSSSSQVGGIAYGQQIEIVTSTGVIGTFTISGGVGPLSSGNVNTLHVEFNSDFYPVDGQIITLLDIPTGEEGLWQDIQLLGATDCYAGSGYKVKGEVVQQGTVGSGYNLIFEQTTCTAEAGLKGAPFLVT